MEFSQEVIQSLRQALQDSPDNLPLRQHLADLLLHHGDPQEAAEQFRLVLKAQPQSQHVQMGLAEAYLKAEKLSAAAVVLEEILKQSDAPPRAQLLLARLQAQQGQIAEARTDYEAAVARDPALADPELEAQLFVQVSQQLNRLKFSQPPEPLPPLQLSSDELPALPVPESDGFSDLESLLGQMADDDDGELLGSEHERPTLTFDDVGGMQAVKEALAVKLIQPLQHPELFRAYGKSMGGGLLMYGPPGCGKTHLARATAGEVQAAFLAVGINDILEMWLGQSERNLHALFEQARSMKPCVLFFDEVDALGASRSDMRHSAGRQLINQFLLELDGMSASNEGVLILAATNAPWHLDTAFRRPGRFDRLLFVPPPDLAGREAILKILLDTKPCEKIDLQALAKKTQGFSGADLKALVEVAVEAKLQVALKSGELQPLRQKDLLHALKTLRPTTKEWFSTARNYALYANQSGFYDEILHYLNAQ